jgi:uncharacterized membrane protein YdjX (TVP38/TMEM64 family)
MSVSVRTRRLLAGGAIAIGVTLVVLAGIRWGGSLWSLFRNPDRIQELIRSKGIWAPLAFIVLQVIQIVVAPLPGSVVSVVAGFVFGFGKGLLLAMIGVVLGAGVAFLLSRWIGRRVLKLFVPEATMDRFDRFVVARGPFYVFLLLLLPNPVGDWLYYLAGLTALPFPFFLLLVLAGRIPSNVLEVFIGVQVYKLGSRGYHLALWQWIAFGAAIAALAIAYFLNRKRIEALILRLTHFTETETRNPKL